MPSLIEGEARQAVKRAVPKSSNKIHAAGVARLYIAYPDRHRWTYTGFQGAAVLANDLVGNTFWLKLVDISPSNRGVIWDQEIYESFLYNQDRVFFHTFELEDCLAGLSFVDDKEAKQFKKKMDEREKNAHKNTKSNPFGNVTDQHANEKSHSRFGGIGRNLLHGHRHSSAPQAPQPQTTITRKEVPSGSGHGGSVLDNIDPAVLKELMDLGLTKDQLVENADFIRSYIEQRQSPADTSERTKQVPPPPQPLTPQDTGNTTGSSRRGLPPPAPPARGGTRPDNARPPSPPSEPEPSPARAAAQTAFRVPPPIADAGRFAQKDDSSSSPNRPVPGSTPGPPPPPRPPKTPLEEERAEKPSAASGHSTVFGVPPPFSGERKPVPPPSRGTAPPPPAPRRGGSGATSNAPPPPARDVSGGHAVPPTSVAPPLPPKTPNAPSPPSSTRPVPPARDARAVPPPPPMPARHDDPPPPPMPPRNDAPAPPPMPSRSNATAPPPPPPPPPPGDSATPPAPPLPPGMTPVTANAPSIPQGAAGRDGLLSDIRGGARLKKVSDAEKRDRSAAAVAGGGGGDSGPAAPGSSGGAASGDAGGLAGALASALAARKSKVSQSDDEDDKDDW